MGVVYVKTVTSRDFSENTYILNFNNLIYIIDPGGSAEEIQAAISGEESAVNSILLTHGHYDHIFSATSFRGIKILAHEKEKGIIEDANKNMSFLIGAPVEVRGAEYYGGDIYERDGLRFYLTPGHTAGSVVIEAGKCLFTGDTLFFDTVGRTDLYSGDAESMKRSLGIFGRFDKDSICYPGHGQPFRLSDAFENNYFLR